MVGLSFAARLTGMYTAIGVIITYIMLAPTAMSATSLTFSPSSVALPHVGSSAVITVSTAGIAVNTNGVQIGITHGSDLLVSNVSCTGPAATGTAFGPF